MKDLKTTFTEKKDNSHIEIVQDKLHIIDQDKGKGMIRKGIVKEMLEKTERQNDVKIEAIRKKLDIEKDIEKERDVMRKEKENDNLKEKIDERLKSIERSMMYTQNNSLAKLTKKIKKKNLNSPLDIDRKRDITVLNTTEISDNEKIDDILKILFVINVNNMDILRNNVIDIIKLLNKSVN